MDNLKIGMQVLGPSCQPMRLPRALARAVMSSPLRPVAALAVMGAAAACVAGCAPSQRDAVPQRTAASSSLVRMSATDRSCPSDLGRNDALLGASREPIVRIVDGTATATIDRQQIMNGRPWTNFRVTTRATSVSQR